MRSAYDPRAGWPAEWWDGATSFVSPYSGEADPLPIDPPVGAPIRTPGLIDVPLPHVNIPSPGPIIKFVGSGVVATGEDVWGWVTGTAKQGLGDLAHVADAVTATVEAWVENYVGQAQKAWLSIVNDLYDYTDTGLNIGALVTGLYAEVFAEAIQGIDQNIGNIERFLYGELIAIDQALVRLLAGAEAYARSIVYGAIVGLEAWAIDNLFHPLLTDIANVEARVNARIRAGVAEAEAYARSLLDADRAALLAKIAAIAGTVALVESWIEDCGEPMCRIQGPKTDLGKLFKALSLASDLALFVALANMDEAQAEQMARDVIGRLGGLIADFEGFVGGGDTFADVFRKAL